MPDRKRVNFHSVEDREPADGERPILSISFIEGEHAALSIEEGIALQELDALEVILKELASPGFSLGSFAESGKVRHICAVNLLEIQHR